MTPRLLAVLAAATVALVPATAAHAAMPALYKNCTNYNATFAHGVGHTTAKDKVAAGARPVTTFRKSNADFQKAMSFNKGLDRDKDSIACEKK